MKIRHKGLRLLAAKNSAARVSADLAPRLRVILAALQAATRPSDMDLPGYRLHPLRGEGRGLWSVRASGNWRVVFRFEAGEAVDVDLIDYH